MCQEKKNYYEQPLDNASRSGRHQQELTSEFGSIATAARVVYVLMDDTKVSKLFAAYADKDAAVELVHPETEETVL